MNLKIALLARLLSISTVLCLNGCLALGASSENQYLKQAEEFSRQQKYDEAIAAYKSHLEYRLQLKDRPEWENPNLYYLIIGDIQLSQGKEAEALASYELAEKNGVDLPLVSDRYRYVARWHETRGEYELALKVLSQYRDKDPMLFDSMADRISKTIVENEKNN